jgi:hypothetical protein
MERTRAKDFQLRTLTYAMVIPCGLLVSALLPGCTGSRDSGLAATPSVASYSAALSKDDLPEEWQSMIEIGTSIAGDVTGVTSGLDLANKILTKFGFIGAPVDPIQEKLTAISGKLDTIYASVHDADFANRRRLISEQVGNSQASRETTLRWISSPPQGMPVGTPLAENTPADVDSLKAVTTLVQEGYWLRPWDDRTYQDDLWQYAVTDRAAADGGLVWDYRVVLPALIDAIGNRFEVLTAMRPGFASTDAFVSELIPLEEALVKIHDRMLAGIRCGWKVYKREGDGTPDQWVLVDGCGDIYTGMVPYWSPDAGGLYSSDPGDSVAAKANGDIYGSRIAIIQRMGIPQLEKLIQKIDRLYRGPADPPAPTKCGIIEPGQGLSLDQSIRSCDGRFLFYMQDDGNLVLSTNGVALWASGSVKMPVRGVVLQGDGNLVIRSGLPEANWTSVTDNNPGARLAVQDDGDVVLYRGNRAIWSTHTGSIPSCGVLLPNRGLWRNQTMRSCDGRFVLSMQSDGNLVLYMNGTPLWATNTDGQPVMSAFLEPDGRLVLTNSSDQTVWQTPVAPGAWLHLQDDGNLIVVKNGQAIWSTNTGGHACGTLGPGQVLKPGQSVNSCNGRVQLAMQADGNLVLLLNSVILWNTATAGQQVDGLAMQSDGNLVLSGQGSALWSSGTGNRPGAWLAVQDDGNVVIADSSGQTQWTTNTGGHVGNPPSTRLVGISRDNGMNGQEKTVAYIGTDGHVHEVALSDGGWKHSDLTQQSGGPAVVGQWLDGFGVDTDHSKQVIYEGSDGYLHELSYRYGDTQWHDLNLNAATGWHIPAGGFGFKGLAVPGDAGKQVVYVDALDWHIRELYAHVGGAYQETDLTAATGAPLPDPYHSLYMGSCATGTKLISYKSEDGHVHALTGTFAGVWSHEDLTQLMGTLPSGGYVQSVFASNDGQTANIVYQTGVDGHLHRLSRPDGREWRDDDVTAISGTQIPVWGDTYAAYGLSGSPSTQIAYVPNGGHLYELTDVGGTWQSMDLNAMTNAPQRQGRFWTAYSSGSLQQIVYTTADGNLHEISSELDLHFQHKDISAESGAPPVK